MTSEPFVSSRFLLKEKPIAYPRYDLIIQDTAGPVFDLGVELEGYDGSVYIRTDHITEMARTLGMATAEEVAEYHRIINILQGEIAQFETKEDLKSELTRILDRFHGLLSPVDDVSVPADIQVAEPDNIEPPKTERKTIGPISL